MQMVNVLQIISVQRSEGVGKLMETFSIPDFLISDRITIINRRITIRYYTPDEVRQSLPLLKRLFTIGAFEIVRITNEKNSELHKQASEIAKDKHLPPVPPGGKYILG